MNCKTAIERRKTSSIARWSWVLCATMPSRAPEWGGIDHAQAGNALKFPSVESGGRSNRAFSRSSAKALASSGGSLGRPSKRSANSAQLRATLGTGLRAALFVDKSVCVPFPIPQKSRARSAMESARDFPGFWRSRAKNGEQGMGLVRQRFAPGRPDPPVFEFNFQRFVTHETNLPSLFCVASITTLDGKRETG